MIKCHLCEKDAAVKGYCRKHYHQQYDRQPKEMDRKREYSATRRKFQARIKELEAEVLMLKGGPSSKAIVSLIRGA